MNCKNCKHFDLDEKESEKLGFNVGGCNAQAYDVQNMKINQCSIYCGHDGGVWVGADFGCVNFESKS